MRPEQFSSGNPDELEDADRKTKLCFNEAGAIQLRKSRSEQELRPDQEPDQLQ